MVFLWWFLWWMCGNSIFYADFVVFLWQFHDDFFWWFVDDDFLMFFCWWMVISMVIQKWFREIESKPRGIQWRFMQQKKPCDGGIIGISTGNKMRFGLVMERTYPPIDNFQGERVMIYSDPVELLAFYFRTNPFVYIWKHRNCNSFLAKGIKLWKLYLSNWRWLAKSATPLFTAPLLICQSQNHISSPTEVMWPSLSGYFLSI